MAAGLSNSTKELGFFTSFPVSLGVRTCELYLCFVVVVGVRAIMLNSLFSFCYVTGEFHRFLHLGRADLEAYHELESIQISFTETHSYPKLFYNYRGAQ